MADRYRTGETTVAGRRFAAVIDAARDDELFCLVDPRECFGGFETAEARAKDISELFNRTRREVTNDGEAS